MKPVRVRVVEARLRLGDGLIAWPARIRSGATGVWNLAFDQGLGFVPVRGRPLMRMRRVEHVFLQSGRVSDHSLYRFWFVRHPHELWTAEMLNRPGTYHIARAIVRTWEQVWPE